VVCAGGGTPYAWPVPPRIAPGHVPIRLPSANGHGRPCHDHPHRVVSSACQRCRRAFCDDCLGTVQLPVVMREHGTATGLCVRCRGEVAALAEIRAWERRPWWQRWRPTRDRARSATIVAMLVGAIALPVGYLVRDIVETPISPEEFARIAIAMRGTFASADGTNYLNAVCGGRFLRASAASVPGYEPSRLIDTWATARVPGWRTQAPVPVEMIFALPDQTVANRLILRPHPSDPPETWVRSFEVSFSTVGPDGPWVVAFDGEVDRARTTPPPTPASGPQVDDRLIVPSIDVVEAPVRWVRLVVRSNGGSPDYTSLGEFEVLYAPRTLR
jgi:hypothetical protein